MQVRAAFSEPTNKSDKKMAGRTDATATPLEIRCAECEVDANLHDWVHERLGRQLGKYAPQIERIQVRFGDDNGPKGGVDKTCLIHVVLSRLPPVVVQAVGNSEREAFDRAAGRVERATRRDMEKHGISTHRKQHGREEAPPVAADAAPLAAEHTALRNVKHDTSGMAYALEDSTSGKPSRKSTRGSVNHIKQANAFSQRAKAEAHAPKRLAQRPS
jgi:ribosome-associated translation inhibitor RaiA